MAPDNGIKPLPKESESSVLSLYESGIYAVRSGIRGTAFTYNQLYHALEQNFLLAYELKSPEAFHDRQLL